MVPNQVIEANLCNNDLLNDKIAEAEEACKPNLNGNTTGIDRQHLYSVYIHAPPKFRGYRTHSLWNGRLIQHRIATQWGSHSLVEATRHLIWEAFRDPLNQRFVLLSESDIPLYDPLTMWQQLMAEPNSRLDTCKHSKTSPWRWDPKMETDNFKFYMWRKSPQWIAIIRSHAELVLRDEEVYRKFEKHCWSAWDQPNNRWFRECFSDEHYFATLLAVEGKDGEGVCESRGVSYTNWQENSAHPQAFG